MSLVRYLYLKNSNKIRLTTDLVIMRYDKD